MYEDRTREWEREKMKENPFPTKKERRIIHNIHGEIPGIKINTFTHTTNRSRMKYYVSVWDREGCRIDNFCKLDISFSLMEMEISVWIILFCRCSAAGNYDVPNQFTSGSSIEDSRILLLLFDFFFFLPEDNRNLFFRSWMWFWL